MGATISAEECTAKCEKEIKDNHNEKIVLQRYEDKYFEKLHKTFTTEEFWNDFYKEMEIKMNSSKGSIITRYYKKIGEIDEKDKEIIKIRLKELIDSKLLNTKRRYTGDGAKKKTKKMKERRDRMKKGFKEFLNEVVYEEDQKKLNKAYIKIYNLISLKHEIRRMGDRFLKVLEKQKGDDKFWDNLKKENEKKRKELEKYEKGEKEEKEEKGEKKEDVEKKKEGFANIDDEMKFKKCLFVLIIMVLLLHIFTDFKIF